MSVSVTPRLSATVLLVRDDPFRVLMVERSAHGPFALMMAFPGGTVDASDHDPAWDARARGGEALSREERAVRIAALRETFEEVGLLVGEGVSDNGVFGDPATHPALDALVPFARWITPESQPKRWDTHFFLCKAPPGEVRCDGHETLAAEWLTPQAALDQPRLAFPTRLNLMRLAESRSVETAIAAARARSLVIVRPRIERRPEGLVSIIPAEAGYAVTEGATMPVLNRPGG